MLTTALAAVLAVASVAAQPDAPADGRAPEPFERVEDYGLVSVAGFDVRVHEELLADKPLWDRVRTHLEADLDQFGGVLPGHAFAFLRDNVTIWAERERAHSPIGMSGRGMCYHPSREWLASNGVLPDKAGGIEIQRAQDFVDWRANQPAMLLHEFAHAWMHRGPVDRDAIEAAYAAAMEAGRYDAVAYNLSSGTRRAYAANNPMEYFAELTEAVFALNDYFPFTRRQLEAHDPDGFAVVKDAWHAEPAQPDGDTRNGAHP
jgi:hypothetical protein